MTYKPIKFLLVDDKNANLFALEAIIRREGLEVLMARSGSDALELLLVNDVSLALIDVQMPVMDGFELAELMRGVERTKHVPIIFVTAGTHDSQHMFKGYESGAIDFLFKPLDPRILKSKTNVFFDQARQHQDVLQMLRINETLIGIHGHNLRNPLATIITGTASLLRQNTNETHQGILRNMMVASHRMTEMIEQLLYLTRVTLKGGFVSFSYERKHLDIGELVQRTVDELRATSPDREIVIETDGDCATWGDPNRLLQLFFNLVGNAFHHGTRGTPILLSIAGDEREIVIRIRNRGVISPELLPTIFEPFGGRTDILSRYGGLGLFISRQIAMAHDGDIEVEVDSISTTVVVTVRLPRMLDHGN